MDAAVSPLTMALVRLLALLAAAAVLASGPHHAGLAPHQPGAHRLRLWRHGLPALAYLLFMGLALPLAILAAAAAYQFTRRSDLSLVLFAAFAGPESDRVGRDSWQLCWLNPCVWALSDDFSNFRHLPLGGLYAPDLAGSPGRGLDPLLAVYPAVWEGASGLPGPERPAGLPAGASPCCSWPAPVRPMPPSPSLTTATRTSPPCRLFELDRMPEGVTCSRPHRPGIPRHRRWHGGRAGPPISSRTPPARGGRSASAWTPGTTSLLPGPMGRRSPFVRTGYEEYNDGPVGGRPPGGRARWSWCWSTAASPGTGTLRRPRRAAPKSAEPICAWRIRT